MNSGRPYILSPGWHTLISPCNTFQEKVSVVQNPIQIGPITIVRVPQGFIGKGMNNTKLEILLPGTHFRRSGTYVYSGMNQLSEPDFSHEMIKFVTVTTGNVRIGYDNGKVVILREGRYVINTPAFNLGPTVSVQQQNLKFTKHRVLLDGGIQMLVEGLLTYHIVDAEKTVRNIGVENVLVNIENITKAEMSKLFAAIHLEQISSITYDENSKKKGQKQDPLAVSRQTMRIRICEHVIEELKPLVESWGVRIINFQIESITMADMKYGQDYEAASLEIAKASAMLKANAAKNEVAIQQAQIEAQSLKIKADGAKQSKIIEAEGNAQVMTTEAKARQEAAKSMNDDFSKNLLMLQERVKFARELKATTLVMSGSHDLAQNIKPMMNLN